METTPKTLTHREIRDLARRGAVVRWFHSGLVETLEYRRGTVWTKPNQLLPAHPILLSSKLVFHCEEVLPGTPMDTEAVRKALKPVRAKLLARMRAWHAASRQARYRALEEAKRAKALKEPPPAPPPPKPTPSKPRRPRFDYNRPVEVVVKRSR